MSYSFKYTSGLHNAGPFQVSGMPFVTGGVACKGAAVEQKVVFPYVTQWIYVINNDGSDMKVGFSKNGVLGSSYFTIPAFAANAGTQGVVLNVKCTEIWVSGSLSVDVMAGLTTIPVSRIENISPSGSNWSGSYDDHGPMGYGISQ